MKKKLLIILLLLIPLIIVFYNRVLVKETKPTLAILVDGNNVSSIPSTGHYDLNSYTCTKGTTLSWNKIDKIIEFTSQIPANNEKCTLNFVTSNTFLLNTVPQGSFVAYTGSNGCQNYTEITGTMTPNYQSYYEARSANACIGQNANQAENSDFTYGFCYGAEILSKGWKVAYKRDSDSDGTSEVYLISAGSPECVLTYESDPTSSISKLNRLAINYCNANYAYGGGCQSTYNPNGSYYNTWAINGIDFYHITEQLYGVGRRLYSYGYSQNPKTEMSSGSTCSGVFSVKECGYNNSLLDNGGHFWFASKYDSTNLLLWYGSERLVTKGSYSVPYGLRPIIHLNPSIYVTGGSGTMNDPYTIGY